MSNVVAHTTGRLTAAFHDYVSESRRPLVSLAFIAPLLALYEGGVLVLGAQAVRNGVDVWLRSLLDHLGLGHYFLLPVLTVALLLAWHHATRDPWQVSATTLYGMLLECGGLAMLLISLGYIQGAAMAALDQAPAVAQIFPAERLRLLGRLIGFFGAGIYEEVLFRLMLLPAMVGLIALLGVRPTLGNLTAIAATSFIFSMAHYVGPQGDTLEWYSFAFRFLAGGFFSVLFVYRGFGIAAGTHAAYDIIAGLI